MAVDAALRAERREFAWANSRLQEEGPRLLAPREPSDYSLSNSERMRCNSMPRDSSLLKYSTSVSMQVIESQLR